MIPIVKFDAAGRNRHNLAYRASRGTESRGRRWGATPVEVMGMRRCGPRPAPMGGNSPATARQSLPREQLLPVSGTGTAKKR
jgi:hypothetical protein